MMPGGADERSYRDQRARARSERVLVEQIEDEVVVYDLNNDKAHLLNTTTAAVWRLCDGATTVAEMAARVSSDLDAPVGDEVVWEALAQLQRADLLEAPVEAPAPPAGMTRRTMIKRMGLAAVAIPVVTSILAPTAAAAASVGLPIDSSCNGHGNCASNYCVGSPKVCRPCTENNNKCPGDRPTCNTTTGNCN